MQVVSFPARQARTHYRHELRAITYVNIDDDNGGIIRNLNHEGVAVQAVTPLRAHQRVCLSFELRFPRLRVETCGQVNWASSSGQCGIHFVDLPARTRHQINQWIFSTLLDATAREVAHPRSIFGASVVSIARQEDARQEGSRQENRSEENDGLTLSASPRPPIRLEPNSARQGEAPGLHQHRDANLADPAYDPQAHLSWLSRPLSGRTLAWLVDSLVVIAALLLFALIFLSITHELPPWPLTVGTASAAAIFVAAAYWAMFAVCGGASLGARLAQAADRFEEEEKSEGVGRFR
jgi:hypothetical protein